MSSLPIILKDGPSIRASPRTTRAVGYVTRTQKRGVPTAKNGMDLGDASQERFVIFNVGSITLKDARTELWKMLQPEVYNNIVSLKRVKLVNRPVCLHLTMKGSAAAGLKRTVKDKTASRTPRFCSAMRHEMNPRFRSKALSKWRIDLYKEVRDRIETATPWNRGRVPKPQQWKDGIATLNINGWKSKEVDFIAFLNTFNVSICAVQETLVSERAYPIKVDGYTVYRQHWKKDFRGQALMVRNHLMSYEIASVEGKYIHVKVAGLIQKPIHVIAIYMPSGGNFKKERKRLMEELLVLNKRILDKDPEAPILMMGDWNMEKDSMSERVKTDITGLRVVPTRGSALSRFPVRGSPRAIDHIVANENMIQTVRKPRVERRVGMSDHRPLVMVVRKTKRTVHTPTTKWVYDTNLMKRYAREIVNSNRWSILNVEECDTEEDSLNERAESFKNAMDETLKEFGAKRQGSQGKTMMPRRLKALLKSRNHWAEVIAQEVAKEGAARNRSAKKFVRAQKAYKRARNQWRLKQEYKVIGYTCADIARCDYKAVWNRITRKIRHDGMSEMAQPVKNKAGELCVTNDEILDAIAEHYDDLANAEPGESQNAEFWAEVNLGEPEEELEGINEEISWPEVLLAIRRMNRNTTPGVDGVHVNMLKELLAEESMAQVLEKNLRMSRPENVAFALRDDELPTEPKTKMGKALYELIKQTWQSEKLPREWNTVLITNLYKSGDPEILANYRGISLISVTLKVLLGVMAERISKACEARGIIVPEQAGFRKNEEAVAQFIAIAEIVKRRRTKSYRLAS